MAAQRSVDAMFTPAHAHAGDCERHGPRRDPTNTVYKQPERANRPITLGRAAISIMITITGTAVTPLMTALQ
jgi:hypothetical protein